jgi:hypothetical protein
VQRLAQARDVFYVDASIVACLFDADEKRFGHCDYCFSRLYRLGRQQHRAVVQDMESPEG